MQLLMRKRQMFINFPNDRFIVRFNLFKITEANSSRVVLKWKLVWRVLCFFVVLMPVMGAIKNFYLQYLDFTYSHFLVACVLAFVFTLFFNGIYIINMEMRRFENGIEIFGLRLTFKSRMNSDSVIQVFRTEQSLLGYYWWSNTVVYQLRLIQTLPGHTVTRTVIDRSVHIPVIYDMAKEISENTGLRYVYTDEGFVNEKKPFRLSS